VKPKLKQIGEREYRYTAPGFDDWLALSAELGSASSVVVSVIASVRTGGGVHLASSVRELAAQVLTSTRAGVLDRLFAGLDRNAARPGEPDRWVPMRTPKAREVWAGDYVHGILVMAWILEVLYSGFLTGATELGEKLSTLLDGLGLAAPTEDATEETE
jgi:hypothetical protein